MTEKCIKIIDRKGNGGAISMDLIKAIDTINHEVLIAKYIPTVSVKINFLEFQTTYLVENRGGRTTILLAQDLLQQGLVIGPISF